MPHLHNIPLLDRTETDHMVPNASRACGLKLGSLGHAMPRLRWRSR